MRDSDTLDDVKTYLTPAIAHDTSGDGADVIALKYLISRWRGDKVARFGEYMKEFVARLFLRFPDGREFELPIPGIANDYLKEIE